MKEQMSHKSQPPQKRRRIDEIRRLMIEQFDTYKSTIKELGDEELEEIVGGSKLNYAGRFVDAVTVAAAGWSIHKTGSIF